MWNDVFKDIFLVLSSGSLSWLLQFKLNSRRQANVLHQQDFNTVSEVVERAMKQLSDLSERIGKLELEKVVLQQHLRQAEMTIINLQSDVEKWKKALRDQVDNLKKAQKNG